MATTRAILGGACAAAVLLSASVAGAAPPPAEPQAAPPADSAQPPSAAPPSSAQPPSLAMPGPPAPLARGERRGRGLLEGQHFQIDPVTDGVTIGVGIGFSVMLELVLSTGEIKPQVITPSDASTLLSFDKTAVSQKIDKSASLLSDVGLSAAIGYAVLDSALSGRRDGWDALIVDAVMYSESASIALVLTDATKIGVRRPRPIDYVNPSSTDTNAELSFFSGHTSEVSAIGATATYLAFMRSGPGSYRPWLTLGGATALTTFVGYERVRSGAHFPTDVIVGALTGTAVGVLVPHLHRHAEEAPPVWIGVAPAAGGGTVSLTGFL